MWRKGDYTYVELSNFYSHIPCGMWRYFFALLSCPARFLLTHPVWDVTAIHDDYGAAIAFLLTHPVWDVTPLPYLTLWCLISTHTSRVGCDSYHLKQIRWLQHFYSHIPCGMWRYFFQSSTVDWCNFYSHIPCGMWPKKETAKKAETNFYSHIPCGMWREIVGRRLWPTGISTHTSRVGCDLIYRQITLTGLISTHTSRVGCDES